MIGLNIDIDNPRGNPPTSELSDTLRAQTVRFTYRDNSNGPAPEAETLNRYRQKIAEMAEAGVTSLIILTNESLPGNPASTAGDGEWDAYISRFRERAGLLAEAFAFWQPAFQIWNEPDYTAPTSSYDPTLRPAVFARLLRHCHEAIKAANGSLLVVTAGLASGNPAWLQQVITYLGGRLPADAIAIHPYGQRPEPDWPDSSWGFGYVGHLIGVYQQVSSLPQWITEAGVNTGGVVTAAQVGNERRYVLLSPPAADEHGEPDIAITSNQLQADYLVRLYNAIREKHSAVVQRVYWFCYSDGMVPPFGLRDSNNTPKPAYTAFQNLPRPTEPSRIYAAQYLDHTVPATLLLGRNLTVRLTLKNMGNWSWLPSGNRPVKLGYRWLTRDGRAVPAALATPQPAILPQAVMPGETVAVSVELTLPQLVGPLNLQFDLLEGESIWFKTQGVTPLSLPVALQTTIATTQGLRLNASHNNVVTGFDNLLQAIDGQPATRWSTLTPQTPGMWFQVDLGQRQTVSRVQASQAGSPEDYPRGYRLRLSEEGQQWVTVATQTNNTGPVDVSFQPTAAQYIRIEQTGSSDRWWWSIHELTITSQVEPTVRASHNNFSQGRDRLTYLLDGNPYTRWSSRAAQRPGMWLEFDLAMSRQISGLTLESRYSPHEYPRGYIIRLSEDGRQWTEVARQPTNTGEVTVDFPPQSARYIQIEQTGQSSRWWWAVHGLRLR